MYWVCEECGWENEYNDEVMYTECQCCCAPATAKNIAEATKALNRFRQEDERQKRKEAIRLKIEKYQQIINSAVASCVKFIHILPKINVAATVLAIFLTVVGFTAKDIPSDMLWNRISSNVQEISSFEKFGESFKMSNQLLSNHFTLYLRRAGFNSKSLIEIIPDPLPSNASLLWDGVQFGYGPMGMGFYDGRNRLSRLFFRLDINSDMNAEVLSAQFSNAGYNLGEGGEHILEASARFFRNMEFFWEKASDNVAELFN